jgi:RNA polymerase sigma factor (sigma-70 family)
MHGPSDRSTSNITAHVAPSPDDRQQQWLRAAVDAYEAPLRRYAERIVGDAETARDVVQETFVRLCRAKPEEVNGHLQAWLFSVCRNQAISVRRKEDRMTTLTVATEMDLTAPSCEPDAAAEQAETAGSLRDCLDRLPANQQSVIRLKFQEGMIEEKRKSGVFLSIFGFGMGNLKDAKLEKLADHGNGQYGYIDSRQEARKVFVEGLSGTLVTMAKDVKLQIEFNPAQVGGYRLIGYENRALAAEDFNNDAKDAGDIGAGHSVTALYEIVPPGDLKGAVDALKYQGQPAKAAADKASDDLFTLKLRYKQPDGETSDKIEIACKDRRDASAHPSRDFDWAAGVAAFGMLLRDSKHKGSATFDLAIELAKGGKGADTHGYHAECIELMRKAKGLKEGQKTAAAAPTPPQAGPLPPLAEPVPAPGDPVYPSSPYPTPYGPDPMPYAPYPMPYGSYPAPGTTYPAAEPVQPAPAAPFAPGTTRPGPLR